MWRAFVGLIAVGLGSGVACGEPHIELEARSLATGALYRAAIVASARHLERGYDHAGAVAVLEAACTRAGDVDLCRRAVAAKKVPVAHLPRVETVCDGDRLPEVAVVIIVTLPGAFVDGVKVKPTADGVARALDPAPEGAVGVAVDADVPLRGLLPILEGVGRAGRDAAVVVDDGVDRVAVRLRSGKPSAAPDERWGAVVRTALSPEEGCR